METYAGTVAWVPISRPCSQTQPFWQDKQELLGAMHALNLHLCMSLCLQLVTPIAHKPHRYPQPSGSRIVWTAGAASPCWHFPLENYRLHFAMSSTISMFRSLKNYQLFLDDRQALPIQNYTNNHHWAWAVAAADFPRLKCNGNARSEKSDGTKYLDILPCPYSTAN